MKRITKSTLPRLQELQGLGWSESSDNYCTYASVLHAEAHTLQLLVNAGSIQQENKKKNSTREAQGKLVSVRVAGKTLIELFMSQSQSNEHRDDVIISISTVLRDQFLRGFRTPNIVYLQTSLHPSPSPFETAEEMTKDAMESTDKDYNSSQNRVLARDGYRCVLTGIFNQASVERCPTLVSSGGVIRIRLKIAHIFNDSAMQDVVEDSQGKLLNKTCTAVSTLRILVSFGFSKFTRTFKKKGGIHEVWNMLTLGSDLLFFFNTLKLWFEHTDKPHRYKVCTLDKTQVNYIHRLFMGDDRNVDGAPMFVEFNTQFEKAPPPDPLLLALHATCARVAHKSGAAEFFFRLELDAEKTRVLASDGSSASLLSDLLSTHAAVQ